MYFPDLWSADGRYDHRADSLRKAAIREQYGAQIGTEMRAAGASNDELCAAWRDCFYVESADELPTPDGVNWTSYGMSSEAIVIVPSVCVWLKLRHTDGRKRDRLYIVTPTI